MTLSADILFVCCVILFAQAFVKLCVINKFQSGHALAALLMIYGVSTIGGNLVFPYVVDANGLNYGQSAICAATFVWIISDRRKGTT